MPSDRANLRVLSGLLLALLLLGAQFHFLSDIDASPSGAHLCPVCCVLSFAILLASTVLCCLPAARRMEEPLSAVMVVSEVFRSISTRAPPAR
jgi:hypothetical protein